jgi:hypothetical protein
MQTLPALWTRAAEMPFCTKVRGVLGRATAGQVRLKNWSCKETFSKLS